MTLACSGVQSVPEHVSVGTQSASKGCTCCRCAVLPSLNMERESCGVPMQTEGACSENAEGMNGATHGAYMTWGVWWMEQGALSTLHEGDCLAGVGEECECWCSECVNR